MKILLVCLVFVKLSLHQQSLHLTETTCTLNFTVTIQWHQKDFMDM